MAPGKTSSTILHHFPGNLSAVLASACLEWLLIAFLFIDAVLSYAITKFARCCKLQVPCILCTKIDHVLGEEKLGYCWDLICSDHKLEISSLVLCHTHNKLVNVHGLCENCLFSFATVNKSNSETYRLLVGKLVEESGHEIDHDPLLGHEHGNPTTRRCTCCGETWVAKECDGRVMLAKSMTSKADELAVVLSAAAESGFLGQDKEGKPLASSMNVCFELDPLSRIGYTEVRITSDTESEVSLSDDNLGALVHESDNIIEDLTCVKTEPGIVVSVADESSEEIIATASALESSVICSDIHLNHTATHATSSNSAVIFESNEHGLGELYWQHCEQSEEVGSHDLTTGLEQLKWQQAENSTYQPALSEEIFPHDLPSSGEKHTPAGVLQEIDYTRANEVELNSEQKAVKDSEELKKGVVKLSAVSETDSEINTTASDVGHQASNTMDLGDAYKLAMGNRRMPLSENSANQPAISEEITPRDQPSSGEKDAAAGVSEEIDSIIDYTRADKVELNSPPKAVKDSEELKKVVVKLSAVSETDSEINTTASDIDHQVSNTLDLGDAYKLAMGNRGRPLSGKLAEQWPAKDSSRVSEDLKQMLSQLSASRGIELVSSTNPRLSVNSDEMKTSDPSNFAGIQILQRRISLERDDSGLSLDGSISEIEGESDIERCKRQNVHYKKLLSALYKELEEERSASAIAASQAMAMITKLQEEKAALNMESLQYLRLMDEQSHYDMEALQKANDFLAEKEKKIQDLEATLELYMNKFSNGSMNPIEKICELKVTDIDLDNQDSACIRKVETGHEKTVIGNLPISSQAEENYISFQDKDMVSGIIKNPLLDFEDERLYILQCLKKLEKHWHLIQSSERNSATCCGHIENERPDQVSGSEENCEGDFQETSEHTETGLQISLEGNEASSGDNDVCDQKVEMDLRGCSCSLFNRANKRASIENVVFDLNLRLQALELDRELLDHTINLLRNGGEGLKFIQDIANNLQELQGVGKRRMDICDY